MPRQGVPYPSREICSLKCQIDALQRQINELMKSVNGVEGDGQGNVSFISGDPAIVINSDQVQHEIEISLDSSQLPAAAVSSVNSQTGAVQLEADDIPSDGNSDVQADIDALKALGVNLQGAINNEVTARGNADSALQGNINTVQASIPGEAANAVANDPTVIQLARDVPNKLDKITSGSSLKAYTHTGATQGEKSVVDGTTADSIGIRDANGRMQAADPASGATDKTLVTANWVSQTGDSSPNNLVHRSGDESKNGALDINKASIIIPGGWHTTYASTGNIGDIKLFAKITARDQGRYMDFELGQSSNTAICYGIISLHVYSNCDCLWTVRRTYGANNPMTANSILIVKDSAGNYYLASRKTSVYGNLMIRLMKETNYGGIANYSNIHLEWINTITNIGDGTGYTLYEAVE